MADHFYSVLATDGRQVRNVTVGTSSSTTKPIELRILDGQGVSKLQIIMALQSFEAYFASIDVPA
jgi:hypothetical protein